MSMSLFRRAEFQFWRCAEPRAVLEWQSFYLLKPLLKRLPQGDGHPVIVFPGFASTDRSTKPLRNLLTDLGYDARGWGLGANMMFDQHLEDEMVAMVKDISDTAGTKVSLIGWSLGGLFAREIAKVCPDHVRGVISMGSPISAESKHTNANSLFRAFNGEQTDVERMRKSTLAEAPPVPTTSIYSKTDGIVAWEGSVQKQGPQTENIEVPASHLGIGVNPLVMVILADRLAQPEGQWQRFKRTGFGRLVYKAPPCEDHSNET